MAGCFSPSRPHASRKATSLQLPASDAITAADCIVWLICTSSLTLAAACSRRTAGHAGQQQQQSHGQQSPRPLWFTAGTPVTSTQTFFQNIRAISVSVRRLSIAEDQRPSTTATRRWWWAWSVGGKKYIDWQESKQTDQNNCCCP